jgi:7-keto-8-aminopelargonate synthetase-like enzyme
MQRPPPRVIESPPGPYTVVDGRRYLYFMGTGYLGLQGHPQVIRAVCAAARQYGTGPATTRAGIGNTRPVLEVERRAAELFAAEDAFYFASGYAAGSILVAALAGRFDAVFIDELSHYSLLQAAAGAGRPLFRFRHADAEDLRATLQARLQAGQRPLVMSDGVFSARGRIAPLADYHRLLQDYPGGSLLVDDAHAVGVLGPHGRGTLEYAGLGEEVNRDAPGRFLCGTLSKAIGGYGGILPGTHPLVERIKATSHWYDGASSPPPPLAAGTAKALELVLADPGLRRRLWENVARLKGGLRHMGLPADDTPAPVICLELGRGDNMRRMQRELQERGIWIAYMAAYSGLGPEGALRLAVFANHTTAMIEELLDHLRQLV